MKQHLGNCFIFFLTGLLCVEGIRAQTYFVKPNGTGPSGLSWSEAFGDLQRAIDSASAGDQIWVAAGEYFPNKKFDTDSNGIFEERERTFYIHKNIALYGGFVGNETARDQRDPTENEVLLNGDIGVLEDTTDDVFHVLFVDGTTPEGSILPDCIIDGFEIEYGNSYSMTFPHQAGSAIFVKGNKPGCEASPTIRNCIIAENYGSYGGTVYNDGRNGRCETTFENCVFEDNLTYSGGAVINNGSNGVCNITFRDCLFAHNYTSYAAGAIWNFNIDGICSLQVINCRFDQNESQFGGAIYNFSHQGTIWSKIVGCEFYLNKAHAYGGGIFNYDFQGDHSSEIINCTFYKNIGWHEGGSIRNWNTMTAATNCIFWDNGDEIANNPTAQTFANYCIFDDGSPGNGSVSLPSGVSGMGNLDQDPSFLDKVSVNLRLTRSSPALNAGTPDTTGLHLPERDLDHNPRMRKAIDLGAYENPFVGCPDSITMLPSYSPFTGIYQAQNDIQWMGGKISGVQMLTLNAPTVQLHSETEINLGQIFSIMTDGCSPE